jgi:hypothetical protein
MLLLNKKETKRFRSCKEGLNTRLAEMSHNQLRNKYIYFCFLTKYLKSIDRLRNFIENNGLPLYRLHTAILNRPLSSAATKEV